MSKFYETFFGMPVAQRQLIADDAGMSLPYILKQTYVTNRNPVFRFQNAVNLDRASKGRLPFFSLTENADSIDWDYVHRRLSQAKRKGLIKKAG